MMSDDIIESVTAEIEAIIQEEINSQNDEKLNFFESQNLDLEGENVQFFDNTEVVAECDSNLLESENLILKLESEEKEISEASSEIQKIELPEGIKIEESDDPNHSNIELEMEMTAESKEEILNPESESDLKLPITETFIEYTVNIGSPSQETVTILGTEDTLAVVPLVEETAIILKDAPIDEKDGPRAKHFKQALRKALNNTVKSCSGEKLESCFPFNLKVHQFVQINSTIFKALQSVIEGVQGPFDEFLESEKLVDKLNKVDEFTRSRVPGSSESTEAEILASLTPQNLIDRKLYSTKLATLHQLEKYAQKLEMENSKLSSDLNNNQNEFIERVDRLKSSQQLLDAALDQISTISMDDLEVLVDKMNHQYQPSALKIHN